LFKDLFTSSQTAIAKPVELFGIREASLYGLIPKSVQVLSRPTATILLDPFFAVFPHMPCNDFLGVFRSGALLERTCFAMGWFGLVMLIGSAFCRTVFELVFLGTYVRVLLCVVVEPPFLNEKMVFPFRVEFISYHVLPPCTGML
jgi:hypothetical protein